MKPPVEAPASRHTRPRTSIGEGGQGVGELVAAPAHVARARPSPRYGSRRRRATPALSTRFPSTRTSPARSRRAAFSRVSHSARATSATSMRALTFACPAPAGRCSCTAPGFGFFVSPSSRRLLSPTRDAIAELFRQEAGHDPDWRPPRPHGSTLGRRPGSPPPIPHRAGRVRPRSARRSRPWSLRSAAASPRPCARPGTAPRGARRGSRGRRA